MPIRTRSLSVLMLGLSALGPCYAQTAFDHDEHALYSDDDTFQRGEQKLESERDQESQDARDGRYRRAAEQKKKIARQQHDLNARERDIRHDDAVLDHAERHRERHLDHQEAGIRSAQAKEAFQQNREAALAGEGRYARAEHLKKDAQHEQHQLDRRERHHDHDEDR